MYRRHRLSQLTPTDGPTGLDGIGNRSVPASIVPDTGTDLPSRDMTTQVTAAQGTALPPASGASRVWRPGPDLVAVAVVAAGAAGLAFTGAPLAMRLPLGLLAVLLLPGYGLTVTLFPARDDLSVAERLGLAMSLSLSLIAFLALGLNASPWKISFESLIISLTGSSVLFAGLAWWRRGRLPLAEQYSPAAVVDAWEVRHSSLGSWLIAGGLGGAVLLATASLTVTLTTPPAPATEFYLLGPDGLAENYPRSAVTGELIGVTAGLTNRERQAAVYRIAVELGETSGMDRPGTGQLLAQAGPVTVQPGDTWEGTVQFVLPQAGKDQRVLLALYRDGEMSPYRHLRLWIDATAPGRS
jgi:uncharacterized membrane protein